MLQRVSCCWSIVAIRTAREWRGYMNFWNSFLAAQRTAKRGICYDNVCLSVRLTSHSWVTPKPFKGSSYFLHLATSNVSSFLAPNFVALNLGVRPERVRQRHSPIDIENFTNFAMSWKRCEIGLSYHYSLTESCIRAAFHWYKTRWPWMTLIQ